MPPYYYPPCHSSLGYRQPTEGQLLVSETGVWGKNKEPKGEHREAEVVYKFHFEALPFGWESGEEGHVEEPLLLFHLC